MNNFSIATLNKKNITDFAKERNDLLKKSKNEWVFFVDSDETVSKALLREIEGKTKSTNLSGFYAYRKNYFLGKHIGTDKILRVVKKGSGKWVRLVHETFVMNKTHAAGVLENCLTHNTADNLSEYITKINRYASMHAIANKKEGKRANLFKIIFYPKFQFIKSLICGRGIVFSMLQAFHSFLAWSELWLLQKN